MSIFKAEFSLQEGGVNSLEGCDVTERRWVSCGDYQMQDISVWRNAIIKRYGSEGVSELQVDDDGYWWFEYPSGLLSDRQIEKDIGITHSGPSVSSSSSEARPRQKDQPLGKRSGKRKRGLSLEGGRKRWRRRC